MREAVDKIFMVFRDGDTFDVDVYDGLDDLTCRVEWQDIYDGPFVIVDSGGNVYRWDASRRDEFATVYNYTLVKHHVDVELGQLCSTNYERLGRPYEFRILASASS